MKDRNFKRKILHDRKFPNSEQISKHQNFERLKSDYSMIKNLLLKKTLIWSGAIIGTAVVVGAIFISTRTTENPISKAESKVVTEKDNPYILPPFPGKATPFSIYRISSKNGATIKHANGSEIVIPPEAFVKKDGMPITDSVDIKYREFHNPTDIFLSGIPMKYDSAGTTYTLESAGMIEIRAFDGDKELNLAQQKAINISMVSLNDENRFNLYELDTVTKNWIYKGKDKIEKPTLCRKLAEKKQVYQPINSTEAIVKPALSDPLKYSFKITYDQHVFPELAAYDNVLFEVTDNNFKPAYFKINWDKISLYNGNEQGAYLVKLKKKDTTITVNAIPVFDKTNYSKALAKFEETHNKVTKDRDQKELEKKSKLADVNKDLSSYSRKDIVTVANNLSNMSSRFGNTVRVFPILRMGFHNCDYPWPPEPVVQLANTLKLTDANAKKIAYSTIFLIEKGKNTVFRFSNNEAIRFNLQAKNLIWTITDKNEIAFFKPSDFSNVSTNNKRTIKPVIAKNQDVALNEIKKFSE